MMNTEQLAQLTPTTERPTEEGWYWLESVLHGFHFVKVFIPLIGALCVNKIGWCGTMEVKDERFDGDTWTGPIDLDAMLEVVRENKRLTAELSTMSKLLLKASIKFNAVGDSFTAHNSPTNGDYYRALAKKCEQAATAEGGK